jgi:hypothetical protein
MECPQWDEILTAEQEEATRPDRGTILRSKRVTLRIDRDCDGCGGRMPAGQTCKRTTYALHGNLDEENLCDACSDPTAGRAYSGGTMGDERWKTDLHR